MKAHSEKQYEAAEREILKRWLKVRGIEPKTGNESSYTGVLMKQVLGRGGNPAELMREARKNLEK